MGQEFTHFDQNGNAVMVDVTEKNVTKREAVATGSIQEVHLLWRESKVEQ